MGIIFGLLSAVFAALTTIVAKIGLNGVDSTIATSIRAIVMGIFFGIFLLFYTLSNTSQLNAIISNQRAILFIVISALCGGISWYFYFRGLSVSSASLIASMDRLSILFIFVISILFLSEKFEWIHLLGVILITAGTVLMFF